MGEEARLLLPRRMVVTGGHGQREVDRRLAAQQQ